MMAFPKLRFKNAEGAEFTSWVTSFIGDECKITTGNKDTQNKIDGGKYPFFVRSQTVERINTYSKDCEAILTSGDGVGVGKNYHYINGKFDFHQRVYCLYDFSNQLLGKYLYIYFSNYFFDRVKRLSAKNSVDSVRMDMISKMEIKLPSLVEQTKIATFLSAVDEKVSQLTQKHQLLSQYKQGMMQKLFSQQIRFKADDGSEFDEWEYYKLGELTTLITKGTTPTSLGGKFENSGINFIKIESLSSDGKFLLDKFAYIDEVTHNKLARSQLENEDILFSIAGALGRVAIISNDYLPANTNQALAIIRLRNKNVTQYIYYFLNSDYVKKIIETESVQLAQANFSLGQLSDLDIVLPCHEEQTKIANFLSAIDQKIDVASEQLEQAKLWKKGLLQQMFV